jgi:caspase domain-containing protein
MAAWLTSEKFKVNLLTDEASPVKAAHVKDAIRDCLSPDARQLVVYFAGHGFVNQLSEFWMLSGAPDDPNEAVNLVGSVLLARQTTVPNIAVISDACRSAPSDLGISNVQGSLIFPNHGRAATADVAVDQFLATRVGEVAYENKLADSVGQFHGLFTTSFLNAFRDPPSEMVADVDGEKVVPNRRLKKYLLSDLPKRIQASGLLVRQQPDSSVTSDDEVYIGHARFTAAQQSAPAPFTTPEDFATRDILGVGPPNTGGGRPELSRVPDYVKTKRELLEAPTIAPPALTANSTVLIVGVKGIISVRISRDLKTKIPGSSNGDAVSIEVVEASNRVFSVFIRFADGSGTVIAGLPRHDVTVVVREGGVASVNYSSRDSNFDAERLKNLRASVAAAASMGAFRLSDTSAAEKFASEIRVMKGVDPTLGLFAAYAYAQAGRTEQMVSVARIMEADLGALLFDVAMLAASAGVWPPPGVGDPRVIAPFCPMLSQGWNLLQAIGAVVPEEFQKARQYLTQALWTTFDKRGMDILFEAQAWKR